MRTAAIDRQLAQEQAKMAEAQADATHAAEQLAKDPSNQKLRVAVVEAQQAVAEVQIGIDALTAARVEAVKYDASDEAQAIRKKRADAVAEIKGHHERMVQVAQAVDEALARAAETLRTFREHRAAAQGAASAYVELMEIDATARSHRAHGLNAVSHRATHGIALGLFQILGAANLLDLSDYLTINEFHRPVQDGGTFADAVAMSAKSAAKAMGEWEQAND